jgi:TRAP-type C4-dicarboxylate transport system permease large subunit
MCRHGVGMGVITTTLGMIVYVIQGITPDIRWNHLKGLAFLGAIIVLFALLIIFPSIATFLPSLMM